MHWEDTVGHEFGHYFAWKQDSPKVVTAVAACVPEYWEHYEVV
jgi:hypothetical protein